MFWMFLLQVVFLWRYLVKNLSETTFHAHSFWYIEIVWPIYLPINNINQILYDFYCNSNIRSSLALFDQAPCNSKWKVGANLLTCHLWSVHDSKFILLISIFRKNNITMFRWMNIHIIFYRKGVGKINQYHIPT